MIDFTPEQLEELNQVLQQFPEHEREEKKQQIMQQLEQQQSQPQQCPFCLMAEGKIKTTNVYEDDLFLGVLEINPANPGHTLLIPKKHITNVTELTLEEQQQFYDIARKLNSSVLQFSEGSSIVLSSGKVTGVKFPHLMFNIIPRVAGDEVFLTWKPKKVTDEELSKFQKLIMENFPKKQEPVVEQKPPLDASKLKEAFERMQKRKL